MIDQGPDKTAESASVEAGPPTTTPAPADVPAPASTTTVDVVDVTADDAAWTSTPARSTSEPPPIRASKRVAKRKATPAVAEKAKKGKKKLVRSVGLPSSLPVESTATDDRPTTVTEDSHPSTAQRPDSSTKTTTRQATEFDLTDFMASFQPGLTSEARPPTRARAEPSPAAPSSSVQDEIQLLREPSYASQFEELTRGWTQVSPTIDVPGLSALWRNISASIPLPTPPSPSTRQRCQSGQCGHHVGGFSHGSRASPTRTVFKYSLNLSFMGFNMDLALAARYAVHQSSTRYKTFVTSSQRPGGSFLLHTHTFACF